MSSSDDPWWKAVLVVIAILANSVIEALSNDKDS